jgi:hypothetical protein
MTNDETGLNAQMTNVQSKPFFLSLGFCLERRSCAKAGHSFVIRFIRRSAFVICFALALSIYGPRPQRKISWPRFE